MVDDLFQRVCVCVCVCVRACMYDVGLVDAASRVSAGCSSGAPWRRVREPADADVGGGGRGGIAAGSDAARGDAVGGGAERRHLAGAVAAAADGTADGVAHFRRQAGYVRRARCKVGVAGSVRGRSHKW